MQVELLNYFGNDEMICDVARVSYNKISKNYSNEQNNKLIQYLVNHSHTSPFRHPQLQFRIECPIYCERQIFKHQVGISVNSISGRYVDFSDTYNKIETWRKQSKDSKQGSEGFIDNQKLANQLQDEIIDKCERAYSRLLSLGVCKEKARTILPLNLNTKFIWTGSFLAFIHLCELRIKPDAQKETRYIVEKMLIKVKEIENNPFKYTLQAFRY